MPMTTAQLLAGANTQLASYAKNDPVDQFSTKRPFMKWLMDNAEQSIFGNGVFNEKVLIGDSSNYQNYTGDDQVTYNRKDNHRLAPFQDYEAHDGFALNETELAHNGVNITEDREAVMTEAEKIQIVNIIKSNRNTLKTGFQRNLDLEVHRDGTQSSKAVPGLDLLVSTTPTANTVVGGINQSTSTYWQNQVSLNIASTAGLLNSTMETVYRQCMTYGDGEPDFIVAGSKFIDAYAKDVRAQPGSTIMVTAPQKGGVALDGSRTGIFFKGIEILFDPTFDVLQAADNPTVNWDKRCYFLNSNDMKFRPVKGRWLVPRTPPRVYDRYTHYFGLTGNYGLTVRKRNGMAVLSIA
jgi:hypothetical protein